MKEALGKAKLDSIETLLRKELCPFYENEYDYPIKITDSQEIEKLYQRALDRFIEEEYSRLSFLSDPYISDVVKLFIKEVKEEKTFQKKPLRNTSYTSQQSIAMEEELKSELYHFYEKNPSYPVKIKKFTEDAINMLIDKYAMFTALLTPAEREQFTKDILHYTIDHSQEKQYGDEHSYILRNYKVGFHRAKVNFLNNIRYHGSEDQKALFTLIMRISGDIQGASDTLYNEKLSDNIFSKSFSRIDSSHFGGVSYSYRSRDEDRHDDWRLHGLLKKIGHEQGISNSVKEQAVARICMGHPVAEKLLATQEKNIIVQIAEKSGEEYKNGNVIPNVVARSFIRIFEHSDQVKKYFRDHNDKEPILSEEDWKLVCADIEKRTIRFEKTVGNNVQHNVYGRMEFKDETYLASPSQSVSNKKSQPQDNKIAIKSAHNDTFTSKEKLFIASFALVPLLAVIASMVLLAIHQAFKLVSHAVDKDKVKQHNPVPKVASTAHTQEARQNQPQKINAMDKPENFFTNLVKKSRNMLNNADFPKLKGK